MYWLRNAGDTVNAAAMLSKPSTWPSCGRTSVAFRSTPTSAFTDAAYSVRFSRWIGTWPAFGPLAWVSSVFSIQPTNESTSFCAGCGLPGGGIKCPRSLRSAFSQISALSAAAWRSRPSNARPPTFARLLWQPMQ